VAICCAVRSWSRKKQTPRRDTRCAGQWVDRYCRQGGRRTRDGEVSNQVIRVDDFGELKGLELSTDGRRHVKRLKGPVSTGKVEPDDRHTSYLSKDPP
jgi:hypothetical protein